MGASRHSITAVLQRMLEEGCGSNVRAIVSVEQRKHCTEADEQLTGTLLRLMRQRATTVDSLAAAHAEAAMWQQC